MDNIDRQRYSTLQLTEDEKNELSNNIKTGLIDWLQKFPPEKLGKKINVHYGGAQYAITVNKTSSNGFIVDIDGANSPISSFSVLKEKDNWDVAVVDTGDFDTRKMDDLNTSSFRETLLILFMTDKRDTRS
ncbi:hypothetical protein C5B42_01670 [Candidatus Cerribacteria bacterium 'Amazon FNV 2010 28 9']|uniref:Uncharacterized protein n=1 Tax=Candidatus Cerribacteria bacterium 'Amazon FNV 2010 28 9' TaxID=2081795 RepID=A0A317JS79_9BACT|nr:MAG: hypothetical protein C5B42_01670 [Candidatus Cerribacteria bacterium 'Amazon FNV 2010 28 9']